MPFCLPCLPCPATSSWLPAWAGILLGALQAVTCLPPTLPAFPVLLPVMPTCGTCNSLLPSSSPCHAYLPCEDWTGTREKRTGTGQDSGPEEEKGLDHALRALCTCFPTSLPAYLPPASEGQGLGLQPAASSLPQCC